MPAQPLPCKACGYAPDPAQRVCLGCGSALPEAQSGDGDTTASTEKLPDLRKRELILERMREATVGRFDIGNLIVETSTALVYSALDLELNRNLALKVIALAPRAIEDAPRLLSQLRAAAGLSHRNIGIIYWIDVVDDLLLLAMQLMDGASLEELRLAPMSSIASPRFPIAAAQSILLQVAHGLTHAHSAGVIHGNLKPSNVMITEEGEVIITDFGMADLTDAIRTQSAYMSPEQYFDARSSAASDQYSLGAIAYELIAGQPPFIGTRLDREETDLHRAPASLHAIVPETPRLFAEAIMRMLAEKPADRFASLDEVAHAIRSGFDQRDLSAREYLSFVARNHRNSRIRETPYAQSEARRPVVRGSASVHRDNWRDMSPSTAPALDENVQFSVYRPTVVRPAEWYPMLVFAHLSEAPAGSHEQDPVVLVERQAKQMLEGQPGEFQKLVQDSAQAIPREGTITVVPEIAIVEFNPPSQSFQWLESVHRTDFRLRASASLDGTTARGRVTVFHGVIILAELTLSVRIEREHQSAIAGNFGEPVRARSYRKIFASYSHKDLNIVQQFEGYAATLGDRYLRDSCDLRAGEVWSERLRELIREADILQLFWSSNSMASRFVRQEWEYALSLGRPDFIRPTYWEEPMPSSPDGALPPEALRRLHFQQIRATAQTTARGRCRNCAQPLDEDVRICPACGSSQDFAYDEPVMARPSSDVRHYHAAPHRDAMEARHLPRKASRVAFALVGIAVAAIAFVIYSLSVR